MGRKLTHEEFLDKFNKQNKHAKDIEILGTYVDMKTKIKCKCKLDGYEWEATPGNLLRKAGCPKCAGKMKKTHEQFIEELQEINPDIEILGTYKTALTKIKCKCRIDGHIWEAKPNGLLNGHGCPKCKGTIKKTHEQFIQELSQINPDIEVLGTYKNCNTKIKCKCKVCGHIWEVIPNSLLRGIGCPKCAGRAKLTHEEFIQRMSKVNPDIQILGRYVNTSTKILCKCKVCEYEWETRPNELSKGRGCPKCAIKLTAQKNTKTHEQFMQELHEVNPHANNIQVLGTYVKGKTKLKVRCKVCGHEWETTPNNLLKGYGCPICGIKMATQNKTKTHEQFLQEFKQNNNHYNDIEILGTYVNGKTKIKCKCKIHGHIWEPTPNMLLKGQGCPICGRETAAKSHTKTHEQFLQELYEVNPNANNIELLETYVNQKTKIKCKCKVCGYEWEVSPNTLLQGCGCSVCATKIVTQKNTKTHNQFLQELQEVNTDIEVLGTYVNSHTRIKVRCKIDAYEWEAWPYVLLNGSGCPICAYKKNAEKLQYTHEQFMKLFRAKNSNYNNIEILTKYIDSKTKIKCKCKVDGNEWETWPSGLLNESGCPKCGAKRTAQKLTKTYEQFIKELKQINTDIEILGTYVNTSTKIKVRCKIDGNEWETTPNRLLNGCGCPICGEKQRIQKQTKTHEQFLQDLQQVNPNIEVLGTYVNTKTKIKCKCKLDGHEWTPTPNDLLQGYGCPKCSISKGEKRVAQYLDNLGIDYIYNTGYFNDLVGTGGGLLRPDFLIPSLKIWIEYDGIQHFEPVNFTSKMSEEQMQEKFEYTQQNDQIKNQYAQDNNWTLIRIPYWDYDNIEQILDAVIKQKEAI